MNNKVKPKKVTKIVYNCLIFFIAILAFIRWMSAFDKSIVVINAEINSHISNFALSLVFYLGVGFPWILQKKPFNIIGLVYYYRKCYMRNSNGLYEHNWYPGCYIWDSRNFHRLLLLLRDKQIRTRRYSWGKVSTYKSMFMRLV